MPIQIINIGSAHLAGDGEPLRDAFQKINENFQELSLMVPRDITDLTDNQGLLTDTFDGGGASDENFNDLTTIDGGGA